MCSYTPCMKNLATIALALPGVDEGLACAGTALECRTFHVNKKNFLFVSEKEARLKLSASSSEAKRLGHEVGASGWVKLSLERLPPASVLRRWISESHGLVGGGSGQAKTRAPTGTVKRSKRS